MAVYTETKTYQTRAHMGTHRRHCQVRAHVEQTDTQHKQHSADGEGNHGIEHGPQF